MVPHRKAGPGSFDPHCERTADPCRRSLPPSRQGSAIHMRWNWRIVHLMAEPVATPKTRRGRSAARQGLRDSHSREEPRRRIDAAAAWPQGLAAKPQDPAAKPQDDLPKAKPQPAVTEDL